MKLSPVLSGLLCLGALSATPPAALAQAPAATANTTTTTVEKAQVLSATPIVRSVPVQRQICPAVPAGTDPSASGCSLQTSTENLVVAYQVTYAYAGKTYTVQMPYDPGPTLDLHVGPAVLTPTAANTVPASTPAPSATGAATTVVVVSPEPSPAAVMWPWLWFWAWGPGGGGHAGPGPGPGHR